VLVPTLWPGDVVVLDNLAVQQPEAHAAIRTGGPRSSRVRATLWPGLQSHRAGVREAEGVSPCRTRTFDQVVELMAAAIRLFTRRNALTSCATAAIGSLRPCKNALAHSLFLRRSILRQVKPCTVTFIDLNGVRHAVELEVHRSTKSRSWP